MGESQYSVKLFGRKGSVCFYLGNYPIFPVNSGIDVELKITSIMKEENEKALQ